VAERFISGLVHVYGEHPVSTDGAAWYLQVCRFLRKKHHIHSPLDKSLIERTIQYIKAEPKVLMTIFHAGERIVN
jgi:putative transposase